MIFGYSLKITIREVIVFSCSFDDTLFCILRYHKCLNFANTAYNCDKRNKFDKKVENSLAMENSLNRWNN